MYEYKDPNEQFDALRELLSIIYIQLARNYDMLSMLVAKTASQKDAAELWELHNQGKLLAPPPWMSEEDV